MWFAWSTTMAACCADVDSTTCCSALWAVNCRRCNHWLSWLTFSKLSVSLNPCSQNNCSTIGAIIFPRSFRSPTNQAINGPLYLCSSESALWHSQAKFLKTPSLDIRFQVKLFLFRLGLCSHLVSLCPLVPPGHLEPCLTSHPLALTGGGRLPGPCPCVRPRVHPCRCRVGRSTSGPSRRRKQPQRQTQTCCSSKSKAGWTKQRTRVWKK